MQFTTVNPATEEPIADYEYMPLEKVLGIAEKAHESFLDWRETSLAERAERLRGLAAALRKNLGRYAETTTLEMGKPIKESRFEIEKCALTAEVYADNAEKWSSEEVVEADGKKHRVVYQPMGVVLAVMPWNFPFWQALRFAVPTLLAGNGAILKHAGVTTQCAFAIEEVIREGGFPENLFRTILANHSMVADLIRSKRIVGASLTGSTHAGMAIGETCGRALKKAVLELGGSDPFIVLDDVDVEDTAKNAVLGRFINCGQSCIASKRFIVVKSVAEEFGQAFAAKAGELVVGDPTDEKTDLGPLVQKSALEELVAQVRDAVDKGARILTGGARPEGKGYFHQPTVLDNVTPDMKVVSEEVFGPAAPIIVVEGEEEAIRVANDSEFGLGGSVWTRDAERGERLARRIESGAVFVNSITKSDARMPFGGIKTSGLGRELSWHGMREFVNVQGLNIYEHA